MKPTQWNFICFFVSLQAFCLFSSQKLDPKSIKKRRKFTENSSRVALSFFGEEKYSNTQKRCYKQMQNNNIEISISRTGKKPTHTQWNKFVKKSLIHGHILIAISFSFAVEVREKKKAKIFHFDFYRQVLFIKCRNFSLSLSNFLLCLEKRLLGSEHFFSSILNGKQIALYASSLLVVFSIFHFVVKSKKVRKKISEEITSISRY